MSARVIPPDSQHYISPQKLALLPIFSNAGLGVVILLVWVLCTLLNSAAMVPGGWLGFVPKERLEVLLRPSPLLQGYVATIYIGALLAISFFEAPTKFRATQASRASLLDVGRLIFARLGRLELCVSLFLGLGCSFDAFHWELDCLRVLVLLINVFQSVALQPLLDKRARAIILDEKKLPSSPVMHALYVVLEVIKVVILITFTYSRL